MSVYVWMPFLGLAKFLVLKDALCLLPFIIERSQNRFLLVKEAFMSQSQKKRKLWANMEKRRLTLIVAAVVIIIFIILLIAVFANQNG